MKTLDLTQLLRNRPTDINVLVLEDNPIKSDAIEKTLLKATSGLATITRIDDTPSLYQKLENSFFDVASLDTVQKRDGGDVNHGQQSVDAVNKYQPQASSLVYSGREERRARILKNGADFFVSKQDTAPNIYENTFFMAARLSLARQILLSLRKAPKAELKLLVTCENLDVVEEQLLIEARKLVTNGWLAGNYDRYLLELLRRRKWWPSLDMSIYSNMEWAEKLLTLANAVGLNEREVITLLNAEKNLGGSSLVDFLSSRSITSNPLSLHADMLLTVLSYVHRLSAYEPELMPLFWEKSGIYANSRETPPWNEIGLSNYLLKTRENGLLNIVQWINVIH